MCIRDSRCIVRGDYYAILPMLPELIRDADQRQPPALQKEFSSSDLVLDLEETAALLRRHCLMPDQAVVKDGGELLALYQGRTTRVLDRLRRADADDRTGSLNGQESRILELLAEGLTNRQIAEDMFLAEKTVKNYVTSILDKLGMDSRTQAAVYAATHPTRSRPRRP